MDKMKIQEKARNIGKFTLEVLDDIFGKRVLIFAYVLAAIFAAMALFQVFTKYVYEEGFSTADALVATIIHTFTKIWGGILYGVLPGFGVFVIIYVIAKCIRNKNLRLRAEADAVLEAEEAKRLAEERRRQEEEERRMEEERLKAEQEAKQKVEEEKRQKAQKEAEEKARLKAEAEAERKAAEDRMKDVVETTLRAEVDARFAEESARRKAEEEAKIKAEEEAKAKSILAELKNKETLEEMAESVKTTMAPIDAEELSRYFKAQFKGIGHGENYIPILVRELEFIRRTNPTNIGRAASMIYDSRHMTKRPTKFSDWMRILFRILDAPLPADLAQTRYKPTEEIRNRLYFL